jgi:hypothetical protein
VLIVTREALLSAAGFKPVRDLRRSIKRIREAHQAVTPKGAPDHAIRLAAADRVLDLADVRKPRNDGADPSRPVNVNILIGDRAQSLGPARSGYVLELKKHSTEPVVEQGQLQLGEIAG